MNYIKEINAFYERLEQEPLSGAANALWHALIHMNNKARWKRSFSVSGPVLRMKTGLSESSVKRGRKELVEKGYIEVKSQKGGRAPIYTMRSLVVEVEEADEDVGGDFVVAKEESAESCLVKEQEKLMSSAAADEAEGRGCGRAEKPLTKSAIGEVSQAPIKQVDWQVNRASSQVSDRDMTQEMNRDLARGTNRGPVPLVKQYINKTNTKQNKKNASAAEVRAGGFADGKMDVPQTAGDAIVFYQENFGFASPFVAESLVDWSRDVGEDLVIEAMKRALERNKTSWSYVKSILNAWYKKGIRTVADAKTEQVAFENERKQRMGSFHVRDEVIPDWFYEQKREREEKERREERHKQKYTLADLERVKREMVEGRERRDGSPVSLK